VLIAESTVICDSKLTQMLSTPSVQTPLSIETVADIFRAKRREDDLARSSRDLETLSFSISATAGQG